MDYPGKVITKNQVTPSQTSASGVWTVDDAAAAVENNSWPVAGVPNPISRSLRFNSADSAYLNRTPATASNRKTWTWSGWVKRTKLGYNTAEILGCYGASNDNQNFEFRFNASDQLQITLWSGSTTTTSVYRDVSAWYHIVLTIDTTSASNKCRLWVNGVEVTAFATDYVETISLNADLAINTTAAHYIGRWYILDAGNYFFNGYLTEVNFIDGQALDATYFGMTDPQTGAWIPKAYNGTYGTNGFYLNFSNNASTAALGTDYSGNSNTWTTNNFSVTAGAGNDSLTDVPTPWIAYNTTGDIGGVVRGNYATFNPLLVSSAYGYRTLSNGNLMTVGNSATNNGNDYSTQTIKTGKWYAEFTCTGSSFVYPQVGIISVTSAGSGAGQVGYIADSCGYFANGNKKVDAASDTAYGSSFTTNDVIGIAVDADNGAVYFSKNGVFQNSGVPTSGASKTGAADTWTGGATEFYISTAVYQSGTGWNANFGQRPFAYTPPAGFLSLCTTNLPTPTILDGGDYFNTVLWTGTGATNSLTGWGFSPELFWVKSRSNALNHAVFDVVRGTTNALRPNAATAEQTRSGVTSWDTDGVTIGTDDESGGQSGYTYVGWGWKAGGTPAVTNTAGTITSSISVNTTSGFSIVTWSGNNGTNATVGHSLGVAPSLIITKNRSGVSDWPTYHSGLSSGYTIFLNTAGAQSNAASWYGTNAPTSSVFYTTYIGNISINASSNNYVSYCFAPVAGYSAFGSYTGNGSTNGPFVYTGFRPRWVLIKSSSNGGLSWFIIDSSRNTYNVCDARLFPDLSNAETTGQTNLDITSNGFKVRTDGTSTNGSGYTYIYAAFAENPFKLALAR